MLKFRLRPRLYKIEHVSKWRLEGDATNDWSRFPNFWTPRYRPVSAHNTRECAILDRHDFRTAIASSNEAPKCCSCANRHFCCRGLEFEKRDNFCPIGSRHARLSGLLSHCPSARVGSPKKGTTRRLAKPVAPEKIGSGSRQRRTRTPLFCVRRAFASFAPCSGGSSDP